MANLQSWIGFEPDDMPSLVEFHLENCPKLHYLPSGIKNSGALRSMQLRYADSLQIVEDLPVLQELVLQACNGLERISNLPSLEVLVVIGCSWLKDITGVRLLRHVRIIDRELRELPVGAAELLQRLLPNGEDWEIILHIRKVFANLPDESPFFTYTKSSADFHVDQSIGERGNSPVLSGAGIPHEALCVSLDNSVVRTSRIGALREQVRRISTLKTAIRRYLVLYLIMTIIVMQVLSYLLQNRTNREIWLVQTLVIFFTTVLLLLLVFLE
ncbi:hypothetical protein PVAP13_2NG495803 [Panicum virgatum]|uniref:Uncharacterized protein n=1 Tax=Panicum virgatum TaxID=38727 RepID=A0A8T0VTJ3_PANVG|nr:hypothetical protein PVAP13_2NG495803 [Panicum virgatum]